MSAGPLQLNYAQRRPSRWRRYLLAIALMAAVGCGEKSWWPIFWGKLSTQDAQRACLSFAARPGSKASEDRVAVRFVRLFSTQHDLYGEDGNFAFVGRLTNKNGDRLVLIRIIGCSEDNEPFIVRPEIFRAYVLKPGSIVSEPKVLTESDVEPLSMPAPVRSDLSAKSGLQWIGAADTTDHSRFSIPFLALNRPGMFRGWLDDSDHIHLVDTSAQSIWSQYSKALYSLNGPQ